MNIKFYELKYMILDSFYRAFIDHKHTVGEAVGITYYSIYGYKEPMGIELIIMKSTLMELHLRYGGKITDYKKKELETLIDLSLKIDAKSQLTVEEYEEYEEDVERLQAAYFQLEKQEAEK